MTVEIPMWVVWAIVAYAALALGTWLQIAVMAALNPDAEERPWVNPSRREHLLWSLRWWRFHWAVARVLVRRFVRRVST